MAASLATRASRRHRTICLPIAEERHFAQRLRRLRRWATDHLKGIVLEKIVDLCNKSDR